MQQQRQKQTYRFIKLGLVTVLIGGVSAGALNRWQRPEEQTQPTFELPQPDQVQVRQINALKSLPPTQRTEKLQAIAQQKPKASIDQNRARYLLASDLLQQQQPQQALKQLDGLEADYPMLAPYVLRQRAQAYTQKGEQAQAQTTWKALLEQHPQAPVTAEALYALGRNEPKYWDQAIAQFPAHPRTIEIVQQRLKQNPKQPQLLLLVAKHGLHVDNYVSILNRLSEDYASQLTPADWEAIAFGYWEKQAYGKAGLAYARAPFTPRNAYRIGRGLQLGEKPGAVDAYKRLVNAFPDASETSLGLLRLSRLTSAPEAIGYLDQMINRFPDRAGEALLEKSKLLDQLNSRESAAQIRQLLLSQHGNSDAAAELRWTLARERAAAKDIQTAWKWAAPILTNNPTSEQAPEAGFWVGKWANELGKPEDAKQAFEYVLTRYPSSYYAWRSASMLGWEVGDFTSVRQLQPEVIRPAARPELPVGSETLRELYQLGQDQDAWTLWQTEFQTQMEPTVAQQFTDGVLRLGVGDYLDGIFMVSYLSEREKPEEKTQYQELQQQVSYWQALYPFPYLESIENWSQERQLNPLLVTALIRQESRFMPGIRSSVGATGLMQVMPDTAMWVAEKIQLKQYQLNDPDDNIKLGTWYLDYTHAEYAGNSMLAVASYNAGPGAVAGWVTKKGIADPDEFVEAIPYNETRGYVKSVFENYWNYLRLYNPTISQKLAQVSAQHPKPVQ
ncbi:transglycosylase SLT domain-containing protein [Pantanalinema rosaneae CENA516]|uniref:lytic transglycosylase domain-containing protein n=1 Tax=Pantanalinema rosaneae TaxID=1620701 RepID=UPI003D6E96C1